MAVPPESALAAPNSTKAPPLPRIAATDGELLRLFAKRCEQKSPPPGDDPFAQIMDRHRAMVWRVCRGVLHRRQDAEDAFQATFLILAKRARSIHASESAAGWLYRVAHRTAVASRRLSRKRREMALETQPLAPETALPDLATREMAGVLMEELRRLPAKYQTPLVLRYLEGQSRRAIAEQTDSMIAIVQGQIARGKALLRRRLVQRGVSLSAAMAIVAGSGSRAESAPLTVLGPTTSNATAAAAGSSLVASTAVISLFREGVRAMFLSQAAKPAAALAIAVVTLLLMSAPSLSDVAVEAPQASDQLVLDAQPTKEVEVEAPAVEVAMTPAEGIAPEAEESFRRFRPGDSLLIQVAGAMPDAPIDDVYNIEPTGTVALGPVYGRVKLAGKTIPEAEISLKMYLSGILEDPEVQITNATPIETTTRPTPLNGTVKESWPSGQTKSEREYEDGKVVSAVEYAEDGTSLYEFVDHGPRTETKPKKATAKKLSPEEQREKLFAELELLVKQAEAHLALAKEMIESGGSLREVNDFVRARAGQARSFASQADRQLNQVINSDVATRSRGGNDSKTEDDLIERIRPLAQRIGAADSQGAEYQTQDIVQRLVQAAQAKREDKAAEKVRKEEPPQELDLDQQLSQIQEMIEKAEAEMDKAEKLALLTLESSSGLIKGVFLKETQVIASHASKFNGRADRLLEGLVKDVVHSGSSLDSETTMQALSELQTKIAPFAERAQVVRLRINRAYNVDNLQGNNLKQYRARLESQRDSQTEPKSE